MANSEIDIAFVHMPSIDVTVDYYTFSSEHIFLAVHEENLKNQKIHDIGDQDFDFRVMDYTDLPNLLYSIPKEGQMLHRYAMSFLSHHQITPRMLFQCANTATNLKLAYEMNHCGIFVPEYSIRTIPAHIRSRLIFYYLDEPELKWEFLALYPKETSLGFFARELIRIVEEVEWELPLN